LVFPARAGAVISQLDSVVVAVSPLLASLLRARVSDAGGLIFFQIEVDRCQFYLSLAKELYIFLIQVRPSKLW
jgi:hypothetical protein